MALNVVDWSTRFQLVLPLKDHTPQGARQAFSQWTRIFGPPQKVYDDLGKEFRGTFEKFMDEQSIFLDPASLETPEQRGITERAGRTFKEILAKTLHQVGCEDWNTWEEAVAQVNMTVNRLMNRSGYSPAQRVFGYNPRLPGGLLSGGVNDSGTASRYQVGDVQVQRSMELRCAAAQAFHQADCNQALRNALHHGPRRQVEFEPGQTVYFWRKGVKRYFKNNVSFWHGPAKVVITNPPSTIWLTYQGHLVKASPEHLRLATIEEEQTMTGWIQDIVNTRRSIEEGQIRGMIVLDESPDQPRPFPIVDGVPEPPRPKYQLRQKTPASQVVFQDPAEAGPTKRPRIEGMEEFEPDFPIPEPNPDEVDYEPDILYEEEPDQDKAERGPEREDQRGQTRDREEEEEEERPTKRHRADYIELLYAKVESLAKQRARKEVTMKKEGAEEKEKFQKAITKEIKNNFTSRAYELI